MTNIAIFASGNGGNFEAIAQACIDGRIGARVALMVCDNPAARAIERAKRLGVECLVFNPKDYSSKCGYEAVIKNALDLNGVELVCLAGYMRIVGNTLLDSYGDRMINIHPALLPAFKGAHAIRDAFEYGVKVYGVTIHRVSSELDGGTIIAQRAFEYDGNDLEELERMVHAIEHPLYIETIDKLINQQQYNRDEKKGTV